ncbi:MAG: hypothetical protein COA84_07700 [Robiginitomaculum sp.]|nr:MAG: hypothetical protein COA84_07700 [Robiginitomaculum sp.]
MDESNRIREWRERRGLSQRQLAERIGTNQQAVHRLESGELELRPSHLKVYARALGVRAIDILPKDIAYEDASNLPAAGFLDDEAYKWEPQKTGINGEKYSVAVDALLAGDPNRSAWTLNTAALEGEAMRQGDILILDMAKDAVAGDIICAQIYSGGDAQTVFRIYQPPFLLSATNIKSLRDPILIDNHRVKVVGVVTECLRQNKTVAA